MQRQTRRVITGHDATGWSQLLARTGAEIQMTGSIRYAYVPEPNVAVLVAAGLGVLAGARRHS